MPTRRDRFLHRFVFSGYTNIRLWTNQFYSNGILDGTRRQPQRRKFGNPKERRSRMIIRDVPREIQQMLRRNDSAFESLAERMEKRGQLYWKVSAETRLRGAEGSWCHRSARISHFPTTANTPSGPHPVNLSIRDASICPVYPPSPRKRSILDLVCRSALTSTDSFAYLDSSWSVSRLPSWKSD